MESLFEASPHLCGVQNGNKMTLSKEFTDRLETAKGSDLAHYKTSDPEESAAVDAEINRRIEQNVPKILVNVFDFFAEMIRDE